MLWPTRLGPSFVLAAIAVGVVLLFLSAHPARAEVDGKGGFQESIPIVVPPYRGGLEPDLRLVYDSHAGNGPIGVGWSLAGTSEIRRVSALRGAPSYDDTDRYYLDGVELIPCAGGQAGTPLGESPSCRHQTAPHYAGYAMRIESHQRISFEPSTGGGSWYAWNKVGTKATYLPRGSAGFPAGAVYGWHVSRIEDTLGNVVTYHYTQEDDELGAGQEYLDKVTYNGATIKLYWEQRPDPITQASGKGLLVTRLRLRTIDVLVGTKRARAYALQYRQHAASRRSMLAEVRQYGTDAILDVTGKVVSGSAHPPTELSYQAPTGTSAWDGDWRQTTENGPGWDGQQPDRVFPGATQQVDQNAAKDRLGGSFHAADVDGDGRSDGLLRFATMPWSNDRADLRFATQFADGRGVETSLRLPDRATWFWEESPKDGRASLVFSWPADVNGDGRSDVILLSWDNVDPLNRFGRLHLELNTAISEGNGHFRLGSPSFQRTTWLTEVLSGPLAPQCQPGDVNGDGKADFVCVWQTKEGKQYLGTALSHGNGTFDVSPADLLIADDPGANPVPGGRLPLETRPTAVGDVNADGLTDVQILDLRPSDVAACPQSPPDVVNTCEFRFDLLTAVSNGNGSYQLVREETDWQREKGIKSAPVLYAADLNGDGKSDYLSFAGATTTQGGQALRTMRTAVTSPGGGWVRRTQEVPAALTDRQNQLTLGDVNGDDMTDLLAVARLAPSGGVKCSSAGFERLILVRILAKGDGTFDLPAQWDDCRVSEEVTQPWAELTSRPDLRAADTNGDGLADFLLGFGLPQQKKNFLFGTYDSVSRATGLDSHRWITADLSGDGRDDLLYTSPQKNATYVYSLIRQPEGGYVQKIATLPVPGNPARRSWKVVDANGDGRADLVHIQCHQPFIFTFCVMQFDTFLSNGDGTFVQKARAAFSWTEGAGGKPDAPEWRPMDANGDGRTDLVHLSYWQGASIGSAGVLVKTLLSDGNGGWIEKPLRGPFQPSLGPFEPFPGRRLQDTQSWRAMDVDGDGREDLVRVATSGLDLSVVTLLARGDADWAPKPFWSLEAGLGGWTDVTARADIINWHEADVNGDGKADLVHPARLPNGVRVHTLLSTGDPTNWVHRSHDPEFTPQLTADALIETRQWTAADTNADGRTDLQYVHRGDDDVRLVTLVSTGAGEWEPRTQPVDDPGFIGNRYRPSWQPANVDGDGGRDLVRVDLWPFGGARLHVSWFRSTLPPDLMRLYSSGGGGTLVEYAPSSRYNPSNPPQGCFLPLGAVVQVVASTTARDGRTAVADTASYGYECPRWSQAHRSFLGWTDVAATRPATGNRQESRSYTRYQQSDECLTQLQDAHYRDAQGGYFASRDILTYNPPGPGPPYDCLLFHRNHLEYGTGSGAAQNSNTFFRYDEFGNMTHVFEHGVPTATGDERTTYRGYRPVTGPYIVGVPAFEQIATGVHPATTMHRSTFFCYDGDNGTASSNCPGVPKKGLLTAVQQVDDKGYYVTTRYGYDAVGNHATTTNPRNNGTGRFFEPTYRVFPESVCNALFQCTKVEWDTTLGQITKLTDPNKATTEFEYDPLGRLERVTYPNTTTVTRQYLDVGDPGRQRIRDEADDGTPDGLWTETHLDGLGRVYRVVAEGDTPGGSSVRETDFSDGSLRVHRQSEWFRAGATRHDEVFDYDGAGRLVRQVHPDGSNRTWAYGADATTRSTTVTDELGRPTSAYSDAYGRPVRIEERNAGKTFSTVYTYNAVDEPLTITDAGGNLTVNTWDMLGRKLTIDDPNLGLRTTTYDRVGNVDTQTDALGYTISYTYDELDRPKTKTYPDDTQVVWNYDEAGHGASKGRLTSVVDPSATAGCPHDGIVYRSEEYHYDALGQITSRMKCILGVPYTTGLNYDSLGRWERITYPDGEEVDYRYDAAGRLAAMPRYVRSLRYDAAGRLARAVYSNGTTTSFSYHPKRPWLERTSLTRGRQTLYRASYAYDANGRVRSTASPTNKMNLTYGYDDLDRLLNVTGDQTQRFEYDDVGNLTYNSALGVYNYPDTVPGGCQRHPTNPEQCRTPHAVQRIGGFWLQYDANGSLSNTMDLSAGKFRSMGWTFDHKLRYASDGSGTPTVYGYDGWADRIWKRRGTEETRYYGGLVEDSSTRGLTKYYYADSLLVARKDVVGTSWYHADEHGSVRAITDQSGKVTERYDYTPFGEPTTSSASGYDIGFANGRTDTPNGLVHLGARVYDPKLGRFVSADSIVPDPLTTQAANRYSYTYNNPVSYIDPSGHIPEATASYQGGQGPAGGQDFWLHPRFLSAFTPEPPHFDAPLSPFGPPSLPLESEDEPVAEPSLLSETFVGIQEAVDDALPFLSGVAYGIGEAVMIGAADAPAPDTEGVEDLLDTDWDEADHRWFEIGRGAGHTGFGAAQFVGGAALAAKGGTMMAVGVATSPAGVGVVIAGGGVAVSAAGVAIAQEATTDILAGVRTMQSAMAMPGGTGGGSVGGQPKGGVYVLKDQSGKVVRIGRSKDLAAREAKHRKKYPHLEFKVEYRTNVYAEQRGLEQVAYRRYHHKGDLNEIRPINPLNPARGEYLRAARGFLERAKSLKKPPP